MKYKAGEYVRVRSMTEEEKSNESIGWATEMNQYCGGCYKIRYIGSDGFYRLETVYRDGINEDGYWMFVEDWLEPEDNTEYDIHVEEVMTLFN